MRQLTDEQMRALGSAPDRFVPESHPIRDVWLGVIDGIVCLVTLGNGRVVPRMSHRAHLKWNGEIKAKDGI